MEEEIENKNQEKKEKSKNSLWNYESDHETLKDMIDEFGSLEDDEEWRD